MREKRIGYHYFHTNIWSHANASVYNLKKKEKNLKILFIIINAEVLAEMEDV